MTALLMTVLVGTAGLGIEFGHWYAVKRSMQAAADAAAVTAAASSIAGNTGYAADADAVAAQNGWGGTYAVNDQCGPVAGTMVCVNSPPKYGSHTGVASAIEVVIARPQASFMGWAVGHAATTTVKAHAVASIVVTPGKAGSGCLLALGSANSILVQGNGHLTLSNCDADGHGNISFSGINSRMSVRSFDIAGTVSAPSQLTDTGPPGISNDSNPPADPYAGKRFFTKPAMACKTWTGTNPIPAGVAYCGLNITSNVTLASGIFYIEGGQFAVSGSATVTSAAGGVTIVLTSTTTAPTTFATVSITGNAVVSLTALTTADSNNDTRGLVFFGDPAQTTNVTETFAGNGTNHVTGSFYFPNQTVSLAGNGSFSSPNGCFQIVAQDIVDSGGGTLSDGCVGTGVILGGGSPGTSALALVE